MLDRSQLILVFSPVFQDMFAEEAEGHTQRTPTKSRHQQQHSEGEGESEGESESEEEGEDEDQEPLEKSPPSPAKSTRSQTSRKVRITTMVALFVNL